MRDTIINTVFLLLTATVVVNATGWLQAMALVTAIAMVIVILADLYEGVRG